jgi:hypothetical protein
MAVALGINPTTLRIGLAVAWLVGSWLFGPKQDKNKIFDPGAEEMPRWNTALRGITIPILFGTNRVSSQVIWQHDYTVVRKNTKEDDSGGKGGGSGGGGKGEAQSGSINYEYYWDMIYHIGMVPEEYSLLGGWLGSERLNSDAILSILGGSGGTFVITSDDPNTDAVSMSFEDAFYYSGSSAADGASDLLVDGWSEILADEGVGVRWPGTVYVGFKQLNLGAYPSIPQVSWEIGPGEADFTFDDSIDNNTGGDSAPHMVQGGHPFFTGDDGKTYLLHSRQDSHRIYEVNLTTGGVSLHSTNDTDSLEVIIHAYNTFFRDHPFGLNGVENLQYLHTAVLHPHNYIAAIGNDVGESIVYIFLFKINSASSLECVGYQWAGHVNLASNMERPYLITVTGNRTSTDPILTMYKGIAFGGHFLYSYMLPSIDQIVGAANYMGNSALMAKNRDSTGLILGGGGTSFGNETTNREAATWFFEVPYVDGLGYGTAIYCYVGEADIETAPANTFITGNGATYPNGFMFKIDFGTIPQFDLTLATGPTWPTSGNVTIVNSSFVDSNGDSVIPFDDRNLNADGITTVAIVASDYYPGPSVIKLTSGTNAGVYIVTFSSTLTNNSSKAGDQMAGSLYNCYTRGRVFAYNLPAESFEQIKQIEGQPYTRSLLGYGSSVELDYEFSMFSYLPATEDIYYIHHAYDSTAGSVRQEIIGRLGTLDLFGARDVTPPYVIRQILEHPLFGIDVVSDETTYLASVEYCIANNFLISVQYRRDESVLQIIDDLLSVYGGFLVISNGVVKYKQLEYLDGQGSSVRTIDNSHLVIEREGSPPVAITKGARQDTFNKVKVNYFDRNLEYAQNQVEESDEVDQDLNGIRPREFPAIFVMDETMARTMAVRALWSNLYSRDTYRFTLGWKDCDLEPGDVITLVDSFHNMLQGGQVARIIEWREKERGKFDVIAKQEFEYVLNATGVPLDITSASVTVKIGGVPAVRDFTMYELPAELAAEPRVYVSWASYGFASGANLWVSADGVSYGNVQRIEPYQLNGILMNGLPNADDMVENVELLLSPRTDWLTTGSIYYAQTLPDASQAVRANGGSLLWCGSEMMAYQGATLVGVNRYRFDKLFRAWGGTTAHAHSSGDLCYQQGGGTFYQGVTRQKIGTPLYYKVQPFNLAGQGIDVSSIQAKLYTITGRHWLPQIPSMPQYNGERGKLRHYVGSTIDININWHDTARRAGYGMKTYGTNGYGDYVINSTNYRVEIVGSGNAIVRSVGVNSAGFTYTSSMNAQDNGAWRGNVAVRVTPYNVNGLSLETKVISMELW